MPTLLANGKAASFHNLTSLKVRFTLKLAVHELGFTITEAPIGLGIAGDVD